MLFLCHDVFPSLPTGAAPKMLKCINAQHQWAEERHGVAKEKHWQELHRSKEELEMKRMEHEQKMAIDREEHDLRMTIPLRVWQHVADHKFNIS